MEKKTYGKPALVVEQFVANGYICACYSVACSQGADSSKSTYPDNNLTYWSEAAKGSNCHIHTGSCSIASNNYITTDDTTGQITGGYELSEDQGKITIKTTGKYIDNNSNGKCDVGDIVFWSSYSNDGDRIWNHYGTAEASDSKHPNAS